jgi:hypothetical protein
MKYCPHCGRELAAATKFCPDCGNSLEAAPSSHQREKALLPPSLAAVLNARPFDKFWLTPVCAVFVCIFSLLDWLRIPLAGGFNLFGMWAALNDFRRLLGFSREFEQLRTTVILLSILLIFSFVLMIISFIKHKSPARTMLAFCGFGLAALVALIFTISTATITGAISGIGTGFPVLTLITAIITMIFFIRNPAGTVTQRVFIPKASKMLIAAVVCWAISFIFAVYFPLRAVVGGNFSSAWTQSNSLLSLLVLSLILLTLIFITLKFAKTSIKMLTIPLALVFFYHFFDSIVIHWDHFLHVLRHLDNLILRNPHLFIQNYHVVIFSLIILIFFGLMISGFIKNKKPLLCTLQIICVLFLVSAISTLFMRGGFMWRIAHYNRPVINHVVDFSSILFYPLGLFLLMLAIKAEPAESEESTPAALESNQ